MIGYNNDIEHRGKTFHIQTEDRGDNDDTIETQLFQGGAILDTKITTYTELVAGLEGKERDDKIQAMMKASHRSLYKKLLAGEYDEMVGLEPLEVGEVEIDEEDFQPGRDGVPSAAIELEEGDIGAFAQASAQQEHVDLSKLHEQLEDFTAGGESLAEQSEGAPTMVIDPPSEAEAAEPATPSASGKIDTKKLKERLIRGPTSIDPEVELPETGVKAWTGCEPPEEDLSLTELVEAFLAS